MSTAGELSQRPSELERPDPPPLRIHHLMACAAVAAVQLSLMCAGFPQPSTTTSPFHTGLLAFYQVLSAVGLTLALFSIYWQRRGYAGLTQPGQWLLIVYAISATRQFASLFLTMTFVGPNWQNVAGNRRFRWHVAIHLVEHQHGLQHDRPDLLRRMVCMARADTPQWRIVFAMFAAMAILMGPFTYLFFSLLAGTGVRFVTAFSGIVRAIPLMLCEGTAAAADLVSQRKRAWTHWVGVGLSMIALSLTVCFQIFYQLGWITR